MPPVTEFYSHRAIRDMMPPVPEPEKLSLFPGVVLVVGSNQGEYPAHTFAHGLLDGFRDRSQKELSIVTTSASDMPPDELQRQIESILRSHPAGQFAVISLQNEVQTTVSLYDAMRKFDMDSHLMIVDANPEGMTESLRAMGNTASVFSVPLRLFSSQSNGSLKDEIFVHQFIRSTVDHAVQPTRIQKGADIGGFIRRIQAIDPRVPVIGFYNPRDSEGEGAQQLLREYSESGQWFPVWSSPDIDDSVRVARAIAATGREQRMVMWNGDVAAVYESLCGADVDAASTLYVIKAPQLVQAHMSESRSFAGLQVHTIAESMLRAHGSMGPLREQLTMGLPSAVVQSSGIITSPSKV